MKLAEQVDLIIKEIEATEYPENVQAYQLIASHGFELYKTAPGLINLIEVVKEIESISRLISMQGYNHPSNRFVPEAKSESSIQYKVDTFKREKKRLLASFQKLKLQVESLNK